MAGPHVTLACGDHAHGPDGDHATPATFLRHHHERGLSKRPWAPEEPFAPESTESAVI